MASNDTDPTIRDSVRIKLNQPCEDVGELLLSVNDFILSHAQEDAQLRFDLIRQEVLPFALKKENQKAYKGIAWLYFNLSLLYEEWEKHVEALAMMDSAVYWIDKSGDRARQARLYYAYGDRQIYCGSVAKGHEYYYKSIKLYEELGGYEKEISACFFQLATGYLQMLDMDGLNRIVEKMTELNKRKTLIPCSYDLYSVLTAKYSMLSDEHPENKSFLDSIIYYSHKSIELIEKHGDELPGTMPAWNYYNLACVVAVFTALAAYHVQRGVAAGMADVQACTRRIRELHKGIELGFFVVDLDMEGLFVLPHLLPLGFNSLVIVFHVCNQLQTFLLQIPRSE